VNASVGATTTGAGERGYNPPKRGSRVRSLRELRFEAGLSLRALAEASNVHRAILSQVERGRMVATTAEADRVADALGLPRGSLHTRTVLVHEEAA
jgi:transcriptional regulator with XRE-family HTH domain